MSTYGSLIATFMLVIEIAAVIWAATVVSRRLICASDPLVRAIVLGLSAILQIVGVSELLASLTLFHRWWVFGGQLFFAGLLLWFFRARHTQHPADTGAEEPLSASGNVVLAHRSRLRGATLSIGAALFTLETILSLTRRTTDFDTSNYHIPDAATWIQTGSLWHLPPVVAPFFNNAYPSNGELIGSWLMLPSHSTLLAFIMPMPFGLLCILGTCLLGRELGGRSWLAALAATATVAAPLFYQSVNSLLTDLPGAAGVVVALALLLRSRSLATPLSCVFLAGLSLGLSLGSKPTAIIFGPLMLLAFPWLLRGDRLRSAFLFLLGALLVSAVWYIRNGILLGNPLFPETIALGGTTILTGAAGQLTIYKAAMISQLVGLNTSVIYTWMKTAASWLGPILVLSYFGLANSLRKRSSSATRCVAAIGVIASLAYISTPYTGPANFSGFILENWRYDLIALFIGSALLSLVRGRLVVVLVVVGLAFDGYRMFGIEGRSDLRPPAVAVLVAALVGVGVYYLASADRPASLLNRIRTGGTTVLWKVPVRATSLGLAGLIVASVPNIVLGLPDQDPMQVASAKSGVPPGRVLAVGVQYLGAVIGPKLENRVRTLGAGGVDHEVEFNDSSALDRATASSGMAVMVVGPFSLWSAKAWTPLPQTWRSVGSTPIGKNDRGVIYVRASTAK